ncbi:sulfotransferase domain-containing protein [Rasiella rasia]|uniref:Sulfotransferase domain-containing protein n=1 Tax=Rasiella rasia TaxID=2744027 RepID=A0A6G6GPW6_9FLAO|nr:sulfotransferase domain-containing protein [Rasiella rasia]QIE60626.1 sulfotransferase domain-containing protein [Rasiella rasia]
MNRFNKHIIIVGSARSGTSWLAETIAKQHRYRSLFEPEHEFQTKNGYLLCDKFIETSDAFKEGTAYLKNVFLNRVDSDWIAQNSNRKYKRHLWPFIPKKFVIKFVRCNLLAPYIQTRFNIPVLHIIRNPYEVLQSQQRVQFPWLYNLHHFTAQQNLVTLLKDTYNFDITNVASLSDLEKLTVRWCVENVVPITIQKAENKNYRLVRYEELRNDIHVFLQLCKEFNLEPLATIEKEYTKPSSKTHPKSDVLQKAPTKTTFLEAELQQINSILDIFEVDFYPRKYT